MSECKGEPPASDYFKVKNDWFDALIGYRLPGYEMQCVLFIIRRTYGWQKKEVELSMNDFVCATNILKPNISRSLKNLKYKRLINADRKPGNRNITYSFNKYHNQWRQSEVIENDNFKKSEVIKNDTLKLSKMITSVIKNDNFKPDTPIIVKDNINTIKDNVASRKKQTFDNRSIPFILSDILLSFINCRNGNFKKPDIQKWAYEVDKMIRLDKRSPCGIMNVICWSQADEFWQNNILSTAKLRKQYDSLK